METPDTDMLPHIMIYLTGTSAFEFWTCSNVRTRVRVPALRRVSELADCPATLCESAAHTLETIPCRFSRPELLVPDSSFRVQRSRFTYHVMSRGIPRDSFLRISDKVCIACPALTLVQVSKHLSIPHLVQATCEMEGSYLRMPRENGGMIDELEPLVTTSEIRTMIEATRGLFKSERLKKALAFVEPGSASPKETELFLLLCLTKRRGGAAIGNWELNPSLSVPIEYRKYLGKSSVRPDVFNRNKRIDLEYVSYSDHDARGTGHEDSKRTNVLRAMGIEVIPVHPEDIAHASGFENIVRQTREALGLSYRRTSEEGLAARERLMDELRMMPPIGYR